MAHRPNHKRNFGTASSKSLPVQAPTKPGCFLNTDHLNPDTPFFSLFAKTMLLSDIQLEPILMPQGVLPKMAGVSWDFHFEIKLIRPCFAEYCTRFGFNKNMSCDVLPAMAVVIQIKSLISRDVLSICTKSNMLKSKSDGASWIANYMECSRYNIPHLIIQWACTMLLYPSTFFGTINQQSSESKGTPSNSNPIQEIRH